jgi:chondroitin AC lyase
MYRWQKILLSFGCVVLFSQQAFAADNDLQIVTRNLRQTLLESKVQHPGMSKSADSWLASMQPDGSWSDEVYSDTNREHWKAVEHLPRLMSIVKEYYRRGSTIAAQPNVLNRCLTSLRFWLMKDPHNVNWWHNEIGVPQQMGEILILLGSDAPEDLRHAGTELMKRANWEKQTGANLTDETRIQVMRGCIVGSTDLVSQAYARTWQEVRLAGAGEDGMQADHSFHQHGPLLYCRGYGTVFADDIVEFVNYARGTSFEMPGDRQDLFDAYLLGGPLWMTRGGSWDFGACGRGIVRAGALHGTNLGEIRPMAGFDGKYQQDLQPATTRLEAGDDKTEPIGNRQYWLSDYMAHRRANYFASVRMYSTRTLDTDGLTNGENRKTHHIADGATCLMVNGDEYFNIFPVWDWLKIPGTTVEQNTPLEPKLVSHKGKSGFVGEVSDGTYGCAAMDLVTGPLQASKAWFCFDDEIVCLGAGISCKTANPVFTTVNQCLLHGPANEGSANKMKWVWHDSIGYILPAVTIVHLTSATQTGRWSDIGTGSDEPVSEKVFSLCIDHGSTPGDAKYEYVVLPGADQNQTIAESQNLPVKVIENSTALQAVEQSQLKQVEAVFHQAGKLHTNGLDVAVDQPCLAMLKREGDHLQVSVSNPLNAAMTVNMIINGQATAVELPSGLMAGSSVVRNILIH